MPPLHRSRRTTTPNHQRAYEGVSVQLRDLARTDGAAFFKVMRQAFVEGVKALPPPTKISYLQSVRDEANQQLDAVMREGLQDVPQPSKRPAASRVKPTGTNETDPLRGAHERWPKLRDELLSTEGGTYSAEEAAQLLGITRQAVNERRSKGKLLALKLGKDYRYPAWQFTAEGTLPAFEEVLGLLAHEQPLAQIRFFLSNSFRLSGRRPLDLLRKGDSKPVLQAAKVFGEQGAE